jgi:archaeal flagellin N-terminal-like domain
MKFRENEDAVSPVIGVILMVAITVILAAVIAAFVFGMAGNIQSTKSVAATATQQGADKIIVTYQGGADAASVSWLLVTAPNGTVWYTNYDDDDAKLILEQRVSNTKLEEVAEAPRVGASLVLNLDDTSSTDEDWSGSDHVVVTAHFEDGADQVILDTYV